MKTLHQLPSDPALCDLDPLIFQYYYEKVKYSEMKCYLQVIHDSRFISDLAYHRFGFLLVNVFDTQVRV